jgi:hypothetical protein
MGYLVGNFSHAEYSAVLELAISKKEQVQNNLDIEIESVLHFNKVCKTRDDSCVSYNTHPSLRGLQSIEFHRKGNCRLAHRKRGQCYMLLRLDPSDTLHFVRDVHEAECKNLLTSM